MGGARTDKSARAPAGEGPTRTCILTRAARPAEELLRFVVAPEDGMIVPDLGGKLPGRGVWVSCNKGAVAAAVRKNAFSRSLKRAVTMPPDLADLVERLMVERTLKALSLANKAGLVLTGFAKVEARVAAGGVAALVHGADAAEDGGRKLERRLSAMAREAGRHAIVIDLFTVEQLSLALGRANVVHACLSTGGATALFLAEVERLARYRAAADTSSSDRAAADAPRPTGWDTDKA